MSNSESDHAGGPETPKKNTEFFGMAEQDKALSSELREEPTRRDHGREKMVALLIGRLTKCGSSTGDTLRTSRSSARALKLELNTLRSRPQAGGLEAQG
jgi:hypothetical protein